MNILITGATGFLGSKIVEHFVLQEPDAHIIATGRKFSSDNKISNPRVTYRLGDLANQSFVATLFDQEIDVVINCASLSSLWGKAEAYHKANVVTQENLINQSLKSNVSRFVYISTPSIYYNSKDSLNIKESDTPPSNKINHYARTKFEAEQILKMSGLNYIILRPRALVGKGDTVIMPRLMRAYEENKLKIVGSGENVVNLTSISNMVEAVRLCLHSLHLNEDYNITNGEPVKLWEAINTILELVKKPPVTQKVPYWFAYAVASILEFKAKILRSSEEPTLTKYSVGILTKSSTFDITKAREQLGYKVKQSSYEALEEFADWYFDKGK